MLFCPDAGTGYLAGSPFAVPMMLEIGRERAPGDAAGEMILAEAEADLIAEARP